MNFIARFFLLVLFLSVAELYLLVELATRFSLAFTLALCVFTGVLGGAMVRSQGLATLKEVSQAKNLTEAPGESIISGLILLVIGTMLLTPGFITDTVAFLLLIPPLRRMAARFVIQSFKGKMASGAIQFGMRSNLNQSSSGLERHHRNEDIIIEAEVKEED